MCYHLPQADVMQIGCFHYLTHRCVTNTSCRIVDDASQCLFVIGISHYTEVGNHVLNLLALIEAQSTIDAIRNTILAHLFLKRTTLCIGAIENGKVTIFTLLLSANSLDVVANNHRLLLVAIGRFQRQALTLLILAEHILVYLSFVLANQAVSSLHDELCRTIVLFQFIQSCPIIMLLEVQDIIDVSTSETIDALCIIANYTHPSVLFSQQQYDGLLSKVCILILVHQYITETLYVFLSDVLMILEQHKRLYQQIIEVHRISLTTTLRVPIIYLGNHWTFMLGIVSSPRAGGILLRQQQVVLSH